MNSIVVLGSGSWGTALAIHLARNGQTVYLWGRDLVQIDLIQNTGFNQRYLPGIQLPENIQVTSNLPAALAESSDILITVPSSAFRSILKEIKVNKNGPIRCVWASKGIDPETHQLLHEVVTEIFGEIPSAVLSGPTFAKEVAKGLPTAIALASHSQELITDMIARLQSKVFRVYSSSDIIGVEIGGAMKNVLAIAAGVSDALGLGSNARSALITRGLAEMVRLGLAVGGKQETFMGLAGLGDLILTCMDDQSRNRRLGLALGAGKKLAQAEKDIGQAVEGIRTANEIHHLALKKGVEVPICEQIYRLIYEDITPQAAVNNLLARVRNPLP